LAIAVPILVLLLLIGADFGRVFYMSTGVNNAARAGAQYGSQTVITAADSSGMITAAKTDGSNFANLTATASQCTCAASNTVAACPSTYCTNSPQATFVEVDTRSVFQTLVNYRVSRRQLRCRARPSCKSSSDENFCGGAESQELCSRPNDGRIRSGRVSLSSIDIRHHAGGFDRL
jgi:Flp pilus assembly protein TadG